MKGPRLILELLFWMLMALIALGTVLLTVGWLLTPVLGYTAVIGLLVLLPMVARLVRLIRKRRATAVVSYLDQAVRLNLPISRLLAAARESESGKIAYRIEQVRRRIEEGFPVGDALRRALPELPSEPVALIAGGERLGRLPHALGKALRDQTRAAHSDASRGAFNAAYPFMMMLVIMAVTLLIAIFVLPKFETIFADFGTKLPPVTIALFDVVRSIGSVVLAVTMILLLWWAGRGLGQMIAPSAASQLWRIARDRVIWTLPLAHAMARDRGLANAFDLIADALRGGSTLDRAMEEAAKLPANDVLQDRLERWSAMLRAGASLTDGAKAARMPSLVVEMLATMRGPEAADVFAFLAHHYAGRFSRAAMLIQAASGPIAVIFFGALVAWVAVAMFAPMASMINSMTVQVSGWKL